MDFGMTMDDYSESSLDFEDDEDMEFDYECEIFNDN